MADDLPEDVKMLADAAAVGIKPHIAANLSTDVPPFDGFSKDASASSRASLVVEGPAPTLPATKPPEPEFEPDDDLDR